MERLPCQSCCWATNSKKPIKNEAENRIAEPSGQTLRVLFFPLFPSHTTRLFSSVVAQTISRCFQFCFDRQTERLVEKKRKVRVGLLACGVANWQFFLWIYNSVRSTTVDFGRVMHLMVGWAFSQLKSWLRKKRI